MADWKKYTLEEVCERIYSGGTPSTKHEEYWNGNIKWLSSGETSQRFVYDTDRKITQKGIENSSTKLATKGCTVIATAGQGYTRGQASFLMTDTYMNQSVIACKANEDIILPLYLYYNLDSRYEEFRLLSDGTSTRGGLSGWILKRMEIKVPPISLQEKIVDVLYSIDKKIEENNAINNNLEEQAQAYFDKLFVVNADPNWPECTLSDIGSVIAGGTPSKSKPEYYADQGIAWITPKDLSVDKSKFISRGENDISELGFSKSSATKMPAGTILFSSRAPIGYIAIAQNEVTTNQGFKSVIPNENIGTAYVYFLLKNLLPTIEGMASGSTFKEISGTAMKSVPTVIPDANTIRLFSNLCEPIFKEQEVLESENKHLSTLRDSLLQKLISGEIDVSDLVF